GTRADVFKRAVVFLAEQTVLGCRLGPAVFHEIDVETAVVIAIEKSGAGTHDFRQEIRAARASVMHEVKTDSFGNVLEPGRAEVLAGSVGRRLVPAAVQRNCQQRDRCEKASAQDWLAVIHKNSLLRRLPRLQRRKLRNDRLRGPQAINGGTHDS